MIITAQERMYTFWRCINKTERPNRSHRIREATWSFAKTNHTDSMYICAVHTFEQPKYTESKCAMSILQRSVIAPNARYVCSVTQPPSFLFLFSSMCSFFFRLIVCGFSKLIFLLASSLLTFFFALNCSTNILLTPNQRFSDGKPFWSSKPASVTLLLLLLLSLYMLAFANEFMLNTFAKHSIYWPMPYGGRI